MIIGKVPDFAKDQEDSFFPQDLIRPKDSIGSTKKICARVIFGNNLSRRGFSELSNLYFGEEGVELTLFQWSIELFVHCEDISPGALSLTMAKTLKDSVEVWKKSKTLVDTVNVEMTIIEEFKAIQSFLQKFKGTIIIHDIRKKNLGFSSSLFEKGLLYEVFENKVLLDFPPEKRDKLIVYLEESIKTLFDTKDLDKRLQKIYCRNIRPVSRKGLLNLTSKSGDYVINKWILEKILGYFLSPDLINSYVNKLLPLAGEGKTQKESGKIEGEIKVSSVSEVMSKIEDSSSPGLSRKSAVMVNQSFSDL